MVTSQNVPVEELPTKTKLSWAKLFSRADDAFLCQMVGKGNLLFDDGNGGQTLIEGVDNFVIVILGGQAIDGIAKWGLELPTIPPTKKVVPKQVEPETKPTE